MARFKRGDRVVVVDREPTPADRKSGLYYAHFAGLHGVVDQVYDAEGEVCVEVDQDTLPQGFEPRHLSIQTHVRQKWLNSISETERRGLPEEQKALRLKYTIMVTPDDLAPEGRSRKPKPAEKPAQAVAQDASAQVSGGGAARPSAPAAADPDASSSSRAVGARRPSEEDLAAAEEAHLAELLRRTAE